MLDLGCGYGWHCVYAAEHRGRPRSPGWTCPKRCWKWPGARPISPQVEYVHASIEEVDFPLESFDLVFSSLAIHYLTDFPAFVEKVRGWLKPGGDFVFSVEHPIFTAYGNQDWYYDEQGNILHFPVDRYFYEGQRQAVFLGEDVVKYHRTLTTYLDTLLTGGFALRRVVEAKPPERMLDIPGMKDELRRPMMLLVAAVKL